MSAEVYVIGAALSLIALGLTVVTIGLFKGLRQFEEEGQDRRQAEIRYPPTSFQEPARKGFKPIDRTLIGQDQWTTADRMRRH